MLIRREPAQNSEQTHESAYVLRDPATLPEAEQVTAQGLTDAVSHARVTVKMRMLLDTGPGQLAAGAVGLEEALADGALDTATGACLDFTHSPFGTPGLCTASFLDCLACSNAVAAGTCPGSPGCTAPWTSCAPPHPRRRVPRKFVVLQQVVLRSPQRRVWPPRLSSWLLIGRASRERQPATRRLHR